MAHWPSTKKIQTFIAIVAIISSLMPGLLQAAWPSLFLQPVSAFEPNDIESAVDADTGPNPPTSGLFDDEISLVDCTLGVEPTVFHQSETPPTTPMFLGGLTTMAQGYLGISYPAPEGHPAHNGHNEEVKAGQTILVYVYMKNNSGTSTEEPCQSGGPTNLTLTFIDVEQVGGLTLGSMMNSFVWPNPGSPGLLTPGQEVYGVFSYVVQPSDTTFNIRVLLGMTCVAAYCNGTTVHNEEHTYPSDALVTRTNDPQNPSTPFFNVYGRSPTIRVVGPRASVAVIAPSSNIVATPFSTVDYIIQLTSLGTGQDVINRVTDVGGTLTQCNELMFDDNPTSGPGWYDDEDISGATKVDTRNLSNPGTPGEPLDTGQSIYCHFSVVMDPAIINDPGNRTFTLQGKLTALNLISQDIELNVVAPSVLIEEARVSVTKTIVNPPVADGVAIGGTVTYQIRVTNTGQVDLDNIRLIDSLIGIINVPETSLADGAVTSVTTTYTVPLSAPSPLVNTVTVQAHPVGAPTDFVVEATAAASIVVQQSELKVTLHVTEVNGAPYNEVAGTPAPKPGDVLTFEVEYCNQSTGQFLSNLQYVAGYPRLVTTPPTGFPFVDAGLANGPFNPGCYQTSGTEFTYTVPAITSTNFTDPVINTIRVRATTQSGSLRYAEHTIQVNIVSDEVAISAYRYTLDSPGVPQPQSVAALRGETLYYHVEIDNLSALNLCNVEIRQYIRDSLGNVVPSSPFVVPDAYILWNSGVNGRLNADGTPTPLNSDRAASLDTGNLRISLPVTGSTPDPLYRIFEIYAPSDCAAGALATPFIDRVAVATDISDIQVNSVISVFNESDPGTPLSFGLRLPGQMYRFNYSATNVGVGFDIVSLQYCVTRTDGACPTESFPVDPPNFFTPGDITFQPFQTRLDVSSTLIGLTGLVGDEPTPLQILVTLTAREGTSEVKVRTLYSFPLLTADIPGGIITGDDQLVRGDSPVPYPYAFTNNTQGLLTNVRVLSLLETSPTPVPGVYEAVGIPGFPPNTFYKVCRSHGDVAAGQSAAGICNFTYNDSVPPAQFQLQILFVGRRAANGETVISLGFWNVEEIPHLLVTKVGPAISPVDTPVEWTVTVINQSKYQQVVFTEPDGFDDLLAPDPTTMAGTSDLPALSDFSGFNVLPGPAYQLLPRGQASATATLTPPAVVGFPPEQSFNNQATFIGIGTPVDTSESAASHTVTGTANASVIFMCPIALLGLFIDNPDPWDDTDSIPTVGETKRVWLTYTNLGQASLTLAAMTDALFVRENGRALNFNDISWPQATPGVVGAGETFSYITNLIIRPIDFPEAVDTKTFSWEANISLQNGPVGCDNFEVTWFFDIMNPIQIIKGLQPGANPLAFPGEAIKYAIDMQNRSEMTSMFIQSLDDSLISSSPRQMLFEGSVTPALSGVVTGNRENANADESELYADDVSNNVYVVKPTDPDNLVNTATVNFYVPANSGPPGMEKGPSFPMQNKAETSVSTTNPLVLDLVPSDFGPIAAGSLIDIDVTLTNSTTSFTITGITLSTTDPELEAGLLAAEYDPAIPLTLGPTESKNFEVRTPHYRIPTDFVGQSLTICAQANGVLSELSFQLPQVEKCITIIIEAPDLLIEKLGYEDAVCTQPLPDDDASDTPEAVLGDVIFFKITFENQSDRVFSDLTFTDITNAGDDLSQRVRDAFLAANGNSDDLAPSAGTPLSICVPSNAIAPPSLADPVYRNHITVNATDNGTQFAVEDELVLEIIDENISIGKRTDVNVAFPGSVIQYTLIITNRNSAGLTLVLDNVWDTLVSGTPPTPAPSFHQTCVESGNQLPNFSACDLSVTSIPFNQVAAGPGQAGWTWPDPIQEGVIGFGQQATYTYFYTVQPTDPDPLLNTAGVKAYLYDPNTSPNWTPVIDPDTTQQVMPEDLTVASVAITDSQLLVRKDASVSTALVGSTVTYTISVTNIGDRPVSGLRIIDCAPLTTGQTAPCDTTQAPGSPQFGGIERTANIIPASAATSLDPFKTAFVTYTIRMPSMADVLNPPADTIYDPFINTAYALGRVAVDGSGTLQDVPPGSDTAIVDLIVPGIRITKEASVGSAGIGSTVIYTIQVFNTGDDPLRLDAVVDIVPGNSTWTPITSMNLNSCDDSAPDIAIGPGSTDFLQPRVPGTPPDVPDTPADFACARVEIIVGQPAAGSTEFVNTVRVSATVNPAGPSQQVVDAASAEIDVRQQGVVVTKQAYCITGAPGCVAAQPINTVIDGTQYEYRVTIENAGIEPIQELRLNDAAIGPDTVFIDGDEFDNIGDADTLFDPGETYVHTYLHTADIATDIPQGGSAYTNTVTVIGVISPSGTLASPVTDAFTIVMQPVPVQVTKLGCVETVLNTQPTFPGCDTPSTFAGPGDFIWYQVSAENPGVTPVNNINIMDSLVGDLDDVPGVIVTWPAAPTVLPGCVNDFTPPDCPTVTYVYRYGPVTGTEGSIVNTATLTGQVGNIGTSAQASKTVLVSSNDLLVTIVENNAVTEATAGTVLNFTITVTNNGTDPITNVNVLLPFTDGATPLNVTPLTLAAGASQTFTRSYTVTNANNVMNFEAIANGTDAGLPVSDTDLWSVVRVIPNVSFSKVANTSIASVGDTVTYTLTLQNTSTTGQTLTNLTVTDSLIDAGTWPTSLNPGASFTQTINYTITGNEGNPVINTATVTGRINGGALFSVQDSWEIFIADGDLLVTNTPSVTSANVGDTVSFTYEICNLGTTNDLTNVTLQDNAGAITLPSTTLPPQQCFTFVRDVTLADTDVPQISRTAFGTALTATSQTLSQAVTRTIDVVPASAGGLRIEVTPVPPTLNTTTNNTLTVDIVIRNVGNTTLTITGFTDEDGLFANYSAAPVNVQLDPGEFISFSSAAPPITVTGTTPSPVIGTWTVTAVPTSGGQTLTHSDSIAVPIITGTQVLDLGVDATPSPASPGDTITYTYIVFNVSNQPVTARLESTNIGDCTPYTNDGQPLWTALLILPGGSATATATCAVAATYADATVDHTITVFNQTAPTTPVEQINVSTPIQALDPLVVEILDSNPAVWRAENLVNIRYRVANVSPTITLTNVTTSVTDPTCGTLVYYSDANFTTPTNFNGTLAPLAQVFVQCEYDVVTPPVGTDTITVNVEASAIANGTPVTATDSRDFPVVNPGLSVTLTAIPTDDGTTSSVGDNTEVRFTLVIENTGTSPLVLPPQAETPIETRVYDTNNPSIVVGNLGSGLWNALNTICQWPLTANEVCTIAYNTQGVTAGDLIFRPQAQHPRRLTATVQLELRVQTQGTLISQEASWQINVERASIVIQSLTVTTTTGTNPIVGDTVTFTAIISNNGAGLLQNLTANVSLTQTSATTTAVPNNGIVLTSGRRQTGTAFITIPLTITPQSPTFPVGSQVTATGTWTVDRAATIRADAVASAEVPGVTTPITATLSTTFTTVVDPDAPTTDPEGNPLDPNALDPRITKTVEPASAFPNQPMTFTILVTNGSTTEMANVTVIDAVPDAFPVVSATTSMGASIVSGQLVTVTTGRLGPGARATITITVNVGAEVSVPSLWTNEACANVEGRTPVCAEVEIAVGEGEGLLPTTGYSSQTPDAAEPPVSQGVSGTPGYLSLMAMALFLFAGAGLSRRQRWILVGTGVVVAIVAGGVVLLSRDDQEDTDGERAEVASPTPTQVDPRATLARQPTLTVGPPPVDFTPGPTPTLLPFAPTLRPSPTPYTVNLSGPIRLDIPRLNYTAPVPIIEVPREDNAWDVSELGHNIGWLDRTTWLEPDWGNTVLVAHVQLDDDDPGPFYFLGDMVEGDEIIVYEGEEEHHFQVVEILTVSATAIEVTHPTRDPILTLMTCTNWDMANGIFADRLIIRAEPVTDTP